MCRVCERELKGWSYSTDERVTIGVVGCTKKRFKQVVVRARYDSTAEQFSNIEHNYKTACMHIR